MSNQEATKVTTKVETVIYETVSSTEGRQTVIHVTSANDDYVEVVAKRSVTPTSTANERGVKIKSKDAKDAKGAVKWSGVVKAFVIDMSGSMFNQKLVPPLLARVSELAKKAFDDGDEVIFIPWAAQAASFVLRPENIDSVLGMFAEDRIDLLLSPATASWSEPTSTPISNFTSRDWYKFTCPRLGLEKLESCLNQYHQERKQWPASLQIVFSTDGEFTSHVDPTLAVGVPATYMLSDAFLRDLQQFFTNCQECPVTLIYLGIIRDHVPDAVKLLAAFPANHYLFVRTAEELKGTELKTRLDELFPQTNLLQRLPVCINGSKQITHLVLDEHGRTTCINVKQLQIALPEANIIKRPGLKGTLDHFPALAIRRRLAQIHNQLLEIQSKHLAAAAAAAASASASAAVTSASNNAIVVDEKKKASSGLSNGSGLSVVVVEHDRELLALSKRLEGLLRMGDKHVASSEEDWTRQMLYSCLRLKNLMRQYAAVETQADPATRQRLLLAANQELKMSGVQQFTNAVSKQIVNNRQKLLAWNRTVATHKLPESKSTHFTISINYDECDQKDEKQKIATATTTATVTATAATAATAAAEYSCTVPLAVAEDEEVEFMTAEPWGDLYRAGDTRCQCFLLRHKPAEIHYYTPSLYSITPTNTHVGLSTFYLSVDRLVSVDGHKALYDRPLVGLTAAETYNLALPLWSPNIKFAVQMKLKQLLGLILAGHPLAYHGRSADVYIPAILKMWEQYRLSKSSKVLKDTLLLMNAYRHIRQWYHITNIADQNIVTSDDQIKFFLNGNSGGHAFSNHLEPLIHLLFLAKPSTDDTRQEIERTINRELFFTAVKSHMGSEAEDRILKDYLLPLANQIVTSDEFMKTLKDPLCANTTWKPIKEWPQPIVDTVKRVLNSTDNHDMRNLLKKFIQPLVPSFEFTHFMINIAKHLPDNLWQTIDHSFDIPPNLPDLFKTINPSQAAVDVKSVGKVDSKHSSAIVGFVQDGEMWEWMAFAHERPTNASRREVFVLDVQYSMLTPVLSLVRSALLKKMNLDEQAILYKTRLENGQARHSCTPLMVDSQDQKLLSQLSNCSDAKEFIREFGKHFKLQIDVSREIFVESKSGTIEEFEQHYRIALEALHIKRGKLNQLSCSGTFLPLNCCSFMTCPDFLQPQANLMQHLADRGHDLPRNHEMRCFVSNMHAEVRTLFETQPNINVHDFTDHMNIYSQQYIGLPHIPRFHAIFKHSFPIFNHYYL
jgi:hypothetical protein